MKTLWSECQDEIKPVECEGCCNSQDQLYTYQKELLCEDCLRANEIEE